MMVVGMAWAEVETTADKIYVRWSICSDADGGACI